MSNKKPATEQHYYIQSDGVSRSFDNLLEDSSAYESGPHTYDEWKAIVNPPLTGDDLLNQCKADLSTNRWDKTEQGVTIDGTLVQSDLVSKNEMAGYITESFTNGMTEVHWKLSDGSFVTYPIAQLKKVYQIVAKYRNDCFGIEKSKADEMDIAADPTTVDIETGWPDTTFTTS